MTSLSETTGGFAYLPQAPLILASQSIARKRMFDAAGLVYACLSSGVDEEAIKAAASTASPKDLASMLAHAKAQAVALRHPQAIVVGGDQVMVVDGTIYNKPASKAEAKAQLRTLSGKTHQLITAGVMVMGDQRLWHFVASTDIGIRVLDAAFIDHYCQHISDDLITRAGVYMLEGLGVHIISHINGCPYAALGFPMLECLTHLRTLGLVAMSATDQAT